MAEDWRLAAVGVIGVMLRASTDVAQYLIKLVYELLVLEERMGGGWQRKNLKREKGSVRILASHGQ